MKRIVKTALFFLFITVLLASLAGMAAAAGSASTVTLNQVQQNGADLTMYVSMSDANGYPCTGDYGKEQFAVAIRDADDEEKDKDEDEIVLDVDSVEPFDPQKQGIHYVFSVDVSTSMIYTNGDMMAKVREGLNGFVDAMGPKDTVSILTFGEQVTELLRNSSDRALIKQTIDSLQANEGMTALYKGVIDGVSLASAGGRSTVVVITDGKNDPTDAMKGYTKESIFDQVKNAQTPLYCIGLNDGNGVDTQSLVELANVTGGGQFVISSDNLPDTLSRVQATMRSATVLHATLINPEGKSGFGETSTFIVGFYPEEGGFVSSNELQQVINWKSVPSQVEPTQGPVPKIALTLDEEELKYAPGAEVSLTGSIDVEEGTIAAEDLSLTVNGEKWPMVELMLNGNGYTFSAKGTVPAGTEQLEVRAEIEAMGVGSSIQSVTLIAPTATPAPMLTVELDDSGRDILAIPGQAVTITGAVNIQGDVDPSRLVMYVDGEPCEMTLRQTQPNQYEFTADAQPQQGAAEMSVQIKLEGTETYSRAQRLYLVAPSPTPAPELYLTLNDTTVVYTEGENAVIRGGIQVSGQVEAEDLGLYVNNVRWDMDLEAVSEDAYTFEASNSIAGGDVSQMDVKVRLKSNTSIASNSEKMAVVTPEPSASPVPTRRPEVTPPPTAVPTLEPTPVALEETAASESGQKSFLSFLTVEWAKEHIWLLAAVAAAILLIIVVIIVAVVMKKRKGRRAEEVIAATETINEESADDKGGKTVGPFDSGEEPPTQYGETITGGDGRATHSDSDFVDDDSVPKKDTGTMYIGEEDTGTVILDEDDPSGTQLLEEGQGEGTVWLEPEVLGLEVVVEQLRGNQTVSSQMYRILSDNSLVFGRLKDGTDVQIDDRTVSAKHIALRFDGEKLYAEDLGSKNGMKVNGEPVTAGEKKALQDGDRIRIGQTTLILHFGKPELY